MGSLEGKSLEMRLERKTLKQRDSFVFSRIVVILAASYLECLSAINLCHYEVLRQQASTDRSTKQTIPFTEGEWLQTHDEVIKILFLS